jgi:hypothetical protein
MHPLCLNKRWKSSPCHGEDFHQEFSAHLKPTSSMFAYLHIKSVHASSMAWGTVKWYILLHPGFSCWSSDLFACPTLRTAIIMDTKVITTLILEWIRCQNMVFCDIQQRYSNVNKLILQNRKSVQPRSNDSTRIVAQSRDSIQTAKVSSISAFCGQAFCELINPMSY